MRVFIEPPELVSPFAIVSVRVIELHSHVEVVIRVTHEVHVAYSFVSVVAP